MLAVLGVLLALTFAAEAHASTVHCCTIVVDDGAEGYEVPGVEVVAGDRRADITVRATRRSVVIRDASAPLTVTRCTERSAHEAVCRMPANWGSQGGLVWVYGSSRADRLVAEPIADGVDATVVLDGGRGNDTMIGGNRAGAGRVAFHASWRGFWGHDRVLLGPDGLRLSPRIRTGDDALLVDVGPSAALAGLRLELAVNSCNEWCSDEVTLARGGAVVRRNLWTVARLPLTRSGRGIWPLGDYDGLNIDVTAPRLRATVWLHDLLED